MKRYRFLNFALDTTRNIFRSGALPSMIEGMKEEHLSYLTTKYGTQDFDGKFARWMSIPKPVISVIDEHTHLLEDIEYSYVSGSLYPALTGACCLGERIFNQIISRIRDSYRSHPQYEHVYNKDSINDWNLGIDTLKEWGVLELSTEQKYRCLAKLRNESVHFQPKEQDLQAMAKEAIELINDIINDLFGIRRENKFVSWCEVPGEMYLRKEFETIPFVREFYIPSAVPVGYKHTVESSPTLQFIVKDNYAYPDTEVSDAEFVRLRIEHQGKTQ